MQDILVYKYNMLMTEFLNKSYTNLSNIAKYNHYDICDKAVWHSGDGHLFVFADFDNSYPITRIKKDVAKYSSEIESKYNVSLGQVFINSTYIHALKAIDEPYSRIPKDAQATVKEYVLRLMKQNNLTEEDLAQKNLIVYTVNVCGTTEITKLANENACYHVSSTPPSVVLKEGLTPQTEINRFNLGHSYVNATFMFSIQRILHNNEYYRKHNIENRTEDDPLRAIVRDMNAYISEDKHETWIYKITLPREQLMNDTSDPTFESSVYVHGKVKASNITCIGYYKPAIFRDKNGNEEERLVYRTGSGKVVENLYAILAADEALTGVDLISDADIKAKKYNNAVREMMPDEFYYRISCLLDDDAKKRDNIIKTCLENGESVKQCVLKLLLAFKHENENVYKYLGMKAPYESPRVKYLKKYVKPELTIPDASDPDNYDLYDTWYDELDRLKAEQRKKKPRLSRYANYNKYDPNWDSYEEDLVDIED